MSARRTALLPDGTVAVFLSEADTPPPSIAGAIDDTARASGVARRLEAGEALLYVGDFHNGRQLLAAVRRRLRSPRRQPASLAERWRAERARVQHEATVLGGLLVALEPDGSCGLRRAPATGEAVAWAWGSPGQPAVLSLRSLLGALGAAGWTRKGLEIPGLQGRLTPRFGVFSPTRHAYIRLLEDLDFTGQRVLDVGCGTGVLSLVALQRGARHATGTDREPRAVACAIANAKALRLQDRFCATVADVWVPGRFDRVLCNPPWLPWEANTPLDRAVFDPGGRLLQRLLDELEAHLTEDGEAALLLSDLPERLGLRAAGELEQRFAAAGLELRGRASVPASHGRSKATADPLHQARREEQVVLWRLAAH